MIVRARTPVRHIAGALASPPAQCTGEDARMPERPGALASPPAQCTGEDARTPHARTTIVVTCHREPHF